MQRLYEKVDVDIFVHHVRAVALALSKEDFSSIDQYIADLTRLFLKDPFAFCASESLTAAFKKSNETLVSKNEYIELSHSEIKIRIMH
ncbi:hypothetical protein [Piscirickettsia litoralis]|uniref:Uncharacterized protein n=1 Tax=Piscirickettsia litoralis TaxID=1891921 RepID=A0ABX2ZXA7_9GAMM|nr:hypothetical protein [Piscirickettsia litoralis]ODN41231.1 hypothetical protein BGC07_17610 [Piscirickettsia litoralis]